MSPNSDITVLGGFMAGMDQAAEGAASTGPVVVHNPFTNRDETLVPYYDDFQGLGIPQNGLVEIMEQNFAPTLGQLGANGDA